MHVARFAMKGVAFLSLTCVLFAADAPLLGCMVTGGACGWFLAGSSNG